VGSLANPYLQVVKAVTNFGTSISRERLELETLNLACIGLLTTSGTNERKMQKWVKWVGKGSRDLLLQFWDPLHISGTVGARNFKFGASMQNAMTRDEQ